MSFMSFLDNVNDKASRILSSAYTDVVAEATDEALLSVQAPTIVFICDSVNANIENAPDLIRAIRRRIDNKSPKIQFFTIQLLDAIVKNCGLLVHVEIADTKGLLKDLIEVACRVPSRDGEAEARTAALTLIVNFSLWFSNHPDDRLKILTTLVDWVRKQSGPNAFEGIQPDTTVTIRRVVPRPGSSNRGHQRSNAASNYQRRQQMEYLRLQQEHEFHQSAQPRVVQAIPFFEPTEEEVSGMLDGCVLLAECLNTAEQNNEQIIGNEVVSGVATQIRHQHRDLSRVLSSGADLANFDVLLSVTDTQTAVIQRLADLVRKERDAYQAAHNNNNNNNNSSPATSSTYLGDGISEPHPSSELLQREHSDPAPAATPSTTATASSSTATTGGTTKNIPSTGAARKAHHTRQAEDIDAIEMTSSVDPNAKAAVPSMESLFDSSPQPAPAAAAPKQPAPATSAFPAPSQSMDHTAPVQQGMAHNDNVNSLNADTDDFDSFLSSRLK